VEVPVTDNQIADRVKVLLKEASSAGKTSEHPVIVPGAMNPNQALQVLTMAQRTAEQHLTIATRQAEKTRADAEASAEQIVREAKAHAENVRREADKVLAEARATSERAQRDARSSADDARMNADQILAEARVKAEAIAGEAQRRAEELKLQAQQRYDDAVGGLCAKREGLQQQIEALEVFDREYRARLTSFMQGQLRALWADQPQVETTPDGTPAAAVAAGAVPGDGPPRQPAADDRKRHARG
jgi:cell division septum initiation protein DivIVA